ncbi:hypothetical protein [Grimontia marina]|uniref:Uncharacterized protein n=1 Tax=Grimontia marina TaxID=646534 RepID=A0A128FHA3_9GAMM|nr:hypothetical protein [Grimontia marina]CZF86182.1 hypothetical protein GMA8713_04215 [Grimontia marina]
MRAFNLLVLTGLLEVFEEMEGDSDTPEENFHRFLRHGLDVNDIQDIYTIWAAIKSGEALTVDELELYKQSSVACSRWIGALEVIRMLMETRAQRSSLPSQTGSGNNGEMGFAKGLVALHKVLAPHGFVLAKIEGKTVADFIHLKSQRHLLLRIEPLNTERV